MVLPAPELFPVDGLRDAYDAVLSTDSAGALQYGPTEGYAPLREFLAHRLAQRGIFTTSEEILLTAGSQQGLDLLSKVLVNPQSAVVVEAPSYVGALQAFASREPYYISIPLDEEGMRLDMAMDMLAQNKNRLALLYTVATFQNPSGLTMSKERRSALLENLCHSQLTLSRGRSLW